MIYYTNSNNIKKIFYYILLYFELERTHLQRKQNLPKYFIKQLLHTKLQQMSNFICLVVKFSKDNDSHNNNPHKVSKEKDIGTNMVKCQYCWPKSRKYLVEQ